MKHVLTGALIAALSVSAVPATAQDGTDLLTVVTTPDPQTQLMAMVLTFQAAQQGAAPRILLCGPAGDIALDDAPASATTGQPPRDVSPQALMSRIAADTGATVEVCAIYLPGKGLDASALIDGVGVADPAQIGALIADPNTRLMSF